MSNKTEEALDLPHGNCIMGDECGNLSALRDHYQARPTFEGDEAEVRRKLARIAAGQGWPHAAAEPAAIQALALLDARDAEKASNVRYSMELAARLDAARSERDAALARAERAEQALAERDAAIAEADAVLTVMEDNACLRSDYAYVVREVSRLRKALNPFLPAKPAVDPLIAVLTEALQDAIGPKDALAVRAAIERAGGVKAVFGEGL